MRELTFRGFLKRYVAQLSRQGTNSLYKLAAEAGSGNPRLREPLLLYALYSRKQDILLRAVKDPALWREYDGLLRRYNQEAMVSELAGQTGALSEAYYKVWQSYESEKNAPRRDAGTKELMRKKIRKLQQEKGISNYRLYTDLKLNPGNVNAWLKNGESGKLSIKAARMVLRYAENYDSKPRGTSDKRKSIAKSSPAKQKKNHAGMQI